MNYSMIRYITGWMLKLEAYFMLLPCLVALIYKERGGLAFFTVAIVCFVIGKLFTYKKPVNQTFFIREGFVVVTLSWIVLSVMGSIPFVLNGDIPNIINAIFETVSGFTTTGASILSDVEAISKCSLMWRSFTHWIGGMGVFVFLLAVIPLSGGSNMYLMVAESPGPSVGKLVPKVKKTAMILYAIYICMTLAEILFLLLGGMPIFDSLATSFGTAGTGGFGIKNDSMGSYNDYIQWVVTIFMILFGVNFNVYYLGIAKKWKKALRCEEARVYFGIILVSIVIIAFNIRPMFHSIFSTVQHAAFQVGSIITTTGFSTVDFDMWPQLSKTILVLLMFVGACAGSTGGGIKVSRCLIAFKSIKKALDSYVHPRNVKKIKLEGKPVSHEVVRSVNVFLVLYVVLFAASVLLLSINEFDMITNFTAVAATINNIGPGLELVGPSKNFGSFSDLSKIVLTFDMLVGRLELFPVMLFFYPPTWK
ncbi:TrkH family potassium uptake protein [Velocimicrobium porci]|uniref:TrkH family potassium uptake protein n=1 Tax=Velocimicrobium porci TaxID=2606634 RepID=A0A6L5XVA0_9FIRM|nr:TrkH family potassium uptake protein [Velocimicrobium porci]MSS62437.1 TrkH family potassium uptake protein [Velocimicrobium porci]